MARGSGGLVLARMWTEGKRVFRNARQHNKLGYRLSHACCRPTITRLPA